MFHGTCLPRRRTAFGRQDAERSKFLLPPAIAAEGAGRNPGAAAPTAGRRSRSKPRKKTGQALELSKKQKKK